MRSRASMLHDDPRRNDFSEKHLLVKLPKTLLSVSLQTSRNDSRSSLGSSLVTASISSTGRLRRPLLPTASESAAIARRRWDAVLCPSVMLLLWVWDLKE